LKRALLIASLAVAVAATPALAQHRHGRGGGLPGRGYANPSAGIAADIELARMTGEKKGRWYALRETAAPDAVMFVPQMVLAQTWLKNREDAATAFSQDPTGAWASCDGSLIVTHGARRDGGREGWYTAVWARQPDGAYRWTFLHTGPSESPAAKSDMIEARVAECPAARQQAAQRSSAPRQRGKRGEVPAVPFDPSRRSGQSRDGTLVWNVIVSPDGTHHFTASLLRGGTMQTFRDERVAAAGS
jgi:hypothetical protein